MFINDNAWESSHKLVKLSQTDLFSRELWSGEFRHQNYILHTNSLLNWSLPHIVYDSVKSTRVYMALNLLHRKFFHFLGKSRRISGHSSWWFFIHVYFCTFISLYSTPILEFLIFYRICLFHHPLFIHLRPIHSFLDFPVLIFCSPWYFQKIYILWRNMILLAVWEYNALTGRAPITIASSTQCLSVVRVN